MKIFGAVLMAAGLAVAVAGCQGDTAPTTPSPGTSTSSATPTPGETAETTVPDTPAQPATAGNGKCLDPASPVVTNAVASLGRAGNEAPYLPDGASDDPLGQCPELLWARVTAGGSASSPSHILFFGHDGYLGTATQGETSYASVVGSTGTAVQVRYRWLLGDEPFCCPQGGPVTVTFTLDGKTVTPDRQVPSEVTEPFRPVAGCPVDVAMLREALRGTDIEGRLAEPVELENARCSSGWASAHSGSHGGTTQPARILFRYERNAWEPVDLGSAVPCAEYGAPEELCS